jgi:hypothetical protein
MNKKQLNLVHEWIGPNGPLSNTRVPNIVDLAEHQTKTCLGFSQGMKPLYKQLCSLAPGQVNLYNSYQINNKFVYELEILHTREWITNFKVGIGILENTVISPKILKGVRDKFGYFMLTTPLESFLDFPMLDSIHRYFKIKGIPLSQIIYLTNCPNHNYVYEKYCQERNVTDRINCEYISIYMLDIVNTAQSPILVNRPYVIGPRKKTFLKFNRRYRVQRTWFFLEIFKRNLLDEFHISFDKVAPEGDLTFFQEASEVNRKYELGINDDDLRSLESKLPLILDTNDFSVFPMENNLTDTMKFYDESLIHVIAETNFIEDIMHLTEKTMKPIMYKQPFIFVGPQYALRCLREMGFKTFNNVWDENYDEIDSNSDRMMSILALVEKIARMSAEEKIKISEQVADIVEYNFQHLRNKKPTELHKFIEKYGV